MDEQNPSEPHGVATANLTRETAIAMLKNAGVAIVSIHAPQGVRELTPEEREVLGIVPPGTPTTTEVIDEGRGPM
jgi:hypothetical protein